MRKARKPCGFLYREYLLAYVDDILILSHAPHAVIDSLSQRVTFKAGSVEVPKKSYLGDDVFRVTIHDGSPNEPAKQVWAMSATEYVKRSIQEVEREFALQDAYLPKRTETPLSSGYRPELDFSAELEDSQVNYYQGLIGVLRWIVELGRIDLIIPVSLLPRYMVSPREGHLQQCYHIFAYLKQLNRSKCHGVSTTCFVDADHAGCKVTRRSQTGFIIYVNKAPVVWYSKRQNTVESAAFGSEFIALKTAIDHIDGLRYKF
mmetsp:Transcript_686/g.996  ORF Transcript_686/g.996 Transcript_686/m.996 type:complete len:261 (+) Transcript_686:1341-2123(+)